MPDFPTLFSLCTEWKIARLISSEAPSKSI
jgi:hypothetical protein